MARNVFRLAPRMASLALTFAAPATAALPIEPARPETAPPAERHPGAVTRDERGMIEPRSSFRLSEEPGLWVRADIDRAPEGELDGRVRYRFAGLTTGAPWNRPGDRIGLVGSLSGTEGLTAGPPEEQLFSIGGFYGWRPTNRLTLQADLQYLGSIPEVGDDGPASSGLLAGLNLRYEF